MTQTKEKLVLLKTHYNNFYVAVEGAVGDWACYVGPKSWGFDRIRREGDKISEEEARDLFPEFEHLRWRP